MSIYNRCTKVSHFDFVVTDSDPSNLGPTAPQVVPHSVVLMANSILNCTSDDLIRKATHFMELFPVAVEVTSYSVVLKRSIIRYSLREPISKVLGDILEKVILVLVVSSSYTAPIFTLLKAEGKTHRLCGYCR